MPNAAGDVIIIDGSKLKIAEKIGIRLETAQVHCLVNEQHMCLFCAHFSKLQRKGEQSMPKTKFQNVVFTLMMSFLMVYAMICYNISMNIGGMTNQVFLMAFHEMIIMWPAAFILEFFLVDHLAHKLAFCMVTPQDRPIVITLAISIMIIAIMCPIMSLVATFLFKEPSFGMWVKTWAMNFPMAILYQMFYCGPFVRLIFRAIFERKDSRQKEAIEA